MEKWTYLVPGGRWYLCALQKCRGSVIACNLESPETVPYELIPRGTEDDATITGITFSATEATDLSIKVAIITGPAGKATPVFQKETDPLFKTAVNARLEFGM
jgi:hypothetical protein